MNHVCVMNAIVARLPNRQSCRCGSILGVETLDRRQRKKQRTRAAIQAAAIDLFAERGYRETTIAAIADAADVAIRTVTGHFPTKEDLLFANEPFTAASLAERLAAREDGEPALDAFRDWMATTMAALTAERTREFWRQRWLRSRLILENPELRGRARGAYYEYEGSSRRPSPPTAARSADALAPRLVATTVVSGVREVYASYEAQPAARHPVAGRSPRADRPRHRLRARGCPGARHRTARVALVPGSALALSVPAAAFSGRRSTSASASDHEATRHQAPGIRWSTCPSRGGRDDGSAIAARRRRGHPTHGCWSSSVSLEDADQVDEAREGAGVVAGPGADLLESVAHGVGVDLHLPGGAGDVEVGGGEGADRRGGRRELVVRECPQACCPWRR